MVKFLAILAVATLCFGSNAAAYPFRGGSKDFTRPGVRNISKSNFLRGSSGNLSNSAIFNSNSGVRFDSGDATTQENDTAEMHPVDPAIIQADDQRARRIHSYINSLPASESK